ncbi:interleukin-18 receptor 1-like [Parambassis ranga]|uniref:Interleukin-18 receptor 1-like n=1 Tax=Parambassis ranga TaxID=210632 RepID=A0A6P7ID93_9TELE|nr:interleukin-18 receptor 1-like [Parambassis ranga]
MTTKEKITLLLVLTSLTGVCSQTRQVLHVKADEMVVLWCPHYRLDADADAELLWTIHTTQMMNLTEDVVTSAKHKQMGVLDQGGSLIILRASEEIQGNYSCFLRNASSQFQVKVHPTKSREYEERTQYSSTCYTQEACTLNCPGVSLPPVNNTSITSNGITWHKEGDPLPTDSFISTVEENDSGVYTCTRSYLYQGQLYNMSFTVVLHVKPSKTSGQSVILSPHPNDVFHVDLGSTVVIDCEAVVYSEFDEVFWLSGDSFVESDNSLPVFYNFTRENDSDKIKMTASLVFKKVSEGDLSKQYICKLESDHQSSSFVIITLTQKARPFSHPLTIFSVATVIIILVSVVVCVKLRIDITLFLRDHLGCYHRISDGKSYDAYVMYYKSDTGLTEDDRKRLETVLEESFGYSLCLYTRDVVAEEGVSEAVLDCIEQSLVVLLVPTSSDVAGSSDILDNIYPALTEQQTRFVFITPEKNTGSLPQRLSKAGTHITWRGSSSLQPSSSFWKQLRYHLHAPQHAL